MSDQPKNPLTLHERAIFDLKVRYEQEMAEAKRLQQIGDHAGAHEALDHAKRLLARKEKLERDGPPK